MKNILLLKLAVVTGLCFASQAFGWTWTIENLSTKPVVVRGEYNSCSDDKDQNIAPGETKTFDAVECLLTAITGHGPYGYIIPYESRNHGEKMGRRNHTKFIIIERKGNLTVLPGSSKK